MRIFFFAKVLKNRYQFSYFMVNRELQIRFTDWRNFKQYSNVIEQFLSIPRKFSIHRGGSKTRQFSMVMEYRFFFKSFIFIYAYCFLSSCANFFHSGRCFSLEVSLFSQMIKKFKFNEREIDFISTSYQKVCTTICGSVIFYQYEIHLSDDIYYVNFMIHKHTFLIQ